MKGKQMTLSQAVEYLKGTQGVQKFSLPTLRRAARLGLLKAELQPAPVAYYLVSESDLIEWANSEWSHKPGRK